MKVPVAVFDSSQIEIPNPAPSKFSSFEGQSLTAWRPSTQQHRRPTSQQTSNHSSPRDRRKVELSLEGRSSPQSQNKRNKKWAEPVELLDKRSKTILDILQSKRELKSKQPEQQAKQEAVDGSVRNGSVLGSVSGGNITYDKVVTYPKFVVKESKRSKKADKTVDNTGVNRSQSLRYTRQADRDQLAGKSDMEARRSYRNNKPSRSPTHPEQLGYSAFNPKLRNGTELERYRSSENLQQQQQDSSVDDILMGFFQPDMRDYLQARACQMGGAARPGSTSPYKGRNHSPYDHVPPPPTPASQLLLQLGFDPTDPMRIEQEMQYEDKLYQDRRRSLRDRKRNRDKGSNTKREQSEPGVSNTTQQLIETAIIKRHFQFPNLTAEAHRKSLTTPRHEEMLSHPSRISPSLYNKAKNALIHGGQPINAFIHASTVQSYDVNEPIIETAREQTSNRNELSQSHDQLASQEAARAQSSTGMTRSNSFYHDQQRKGDKTSRMISLGLPRVNIDIDRHHFSHNNRMRRSMELRGKYSLDTSAVEQTQQAEPATKKPMTATNGKSSESHDVARGKVKSAASVKSSTRKAASAAKSSKSGTLDNDSDSDELKGRESSGHLKFSPPPNTPIDSDSVFHRRSTVRKKSSKSSDKPKLSAQKLDPTKGAIGVSFFKMAAPGVKPESERNQVKDSGQKQVHGVKLADDEIYV